MKNIDRDEDYENFYEPSNEDEINYYLNDDADEPDAHDNDDSEPVECLADIPIKKTKTRENGVFSVASKMIEVIKFQNNKTNIYCNPHKNKVLAIRNKVMDFDCTNDAIFICSVSGAVYMARVSYDVAYPSLSFNSLSSMGSSLENYNFVSQVACGDSHALLLTTSGFCYAFGSGKNGRLGLGDNDSKEEPCMLYNLLDFTVESIHATAECSFACCRIRNEIPVPITHCIKEKEKVTTVVDSDKNILFSWGKGEGGCLGHDTEQDINIPTPVTLSIEEDINSIVTGKHHVFALNIKKNCVYAWGRYHNHLVSFLESSKMFKKPEYFACIDKNIRKCKECEETPIFTKSKYTNGKTTDKWQAETAYDSSCIGSSQNESYPSVIEASEKSPFEIHEEMKKQTMQNRIEIKTLEDEDFDEMDDCEIEVEEMNVIYEDSNTNHNNDIESIIKNKKGHLNNEKYRDACKIREMILNKVPDKLRGSVWRSISGNPASISQDYYQLLVAKGDRIGEIIMKKATIEKSGQPEYDSEYLRTKIEYNMMAMKPGVSHEDSIAIIENDLPRTFSTLEFYDPSTEEGDNHVSQLRRILRAFTVMRPDVGYVQGMSYLAGFLLLENTEYQTFILFHNLLIKSQILSFYKFKADEIIQRLKFFRQAFLVELPELCEYFEEEKIDPRSYVYEWIMTIYTRALPMNVTKRVWDLFFIDGFPLLFKTALAILKIINDKIIYSDIAEVMNTLKGTQSIITDDELLIRTIEEVKLPDWVYEELKDL